MTQLLAIAPTPRPARRPLSFAGRAVFTWSAADAALVTHDALLFACNPDRLTADRVRAYCQHMGRESVAFERAVLAHALRAVSVEALVGRLAAPIRSATGEHSLGVRVGLGSRGDGGSGPKCPVPGRLRVRGWLADADVTREVDARWVVSGGAPVELARDPGDPTVGLLAAAGERAMERLSEAVAWHLRTLLDATCEAPLALAVSSPLSAKAYRMYWRRVRDYLVWCAFHDV